jgi:hypothetical protein
LLSHDAASPDATRAPRASWAEVLFGPGRGYVPLSGEASFADVNRVAS